MSNVLGTSMVRCFSRALIAAAALLVLEGRSAAVTTSIVFDVPGFSVARLWTGSSLGVPVSSNPACVDTNTCTNLGAIRFSADGNTLFVVGAADTTTSALYSVSVMRSGTTHEVTNLAGPAVKIFDGHSPAPGSGLDAGFEFGPAGTRFYSYFPVNVLGERVGANEMQFDLSALVPASIAGLVFSPFRVDPGTGSGVLQIDTGYGRNVYEVTLASIGGGFFSPGAKRLFATLANGSLGNIQYVPSAPFAGNLMYVAFAAGEIHMISIDPATGLAIDRNTGQPTLGTANPVDQRFARGFGADTTAGPFGLTFDPLTNDMFVSTFEGDSLVFNSIVQIQGFARTTTTTSAPPTTTSTTVTTATTSTTTTLVQSPACGDVNADGVINVADALLVSQFDVGLRSCGQSAFSHPEVCDVNNDGFCNIGDALAMAQCDVGLRSCSFSCTPFSCP